jgi:FkbM family methyltransferase
LLIYFLSGPDAVWLEQHYTAKQQQHRILQSSSSSSATSSTFLALFVGCNKGYDALNALRMGSANPTFDKSTWNTAMTYNSTITLHNDVCNEITNPQFDIILPLVGIVSSTNNNEIKNNENKEKERFVQVHCIEPMPATVKELQRAAVQTGYDKLGFIVTHAAMSANDGHVAFPRASTVGVENKGISNTDCKSSSSSDDCVNVTMYSLDSYIQTFIPNTTTTTNKEEEEEEEEIPINYLSIDVEGWDYEVLLGGKQNVLQRVHYLEFEYNWVRSCLFSFSFTIWLNISLSDY